MGGMHGFGPVVREHDEPVFHSEWERRTFALALAVMGSRSFNINKCVALSSDRTASVPQRAAGTALYALETLLIEKDVVARTEIEVVKAALRAHPSWMMAKGAVMGRIGMPGATPGG